MTILLGSSAIMCLELSESILNNWVKSWNNNVKFESALAKLGDDVSGNRLNQVLQREVLHVA